MRRNRDMPAYPKANPYVAEPGGLTKREAAAIAAMQGMMANDKSISALRDGIEGFCQATSIASVAHADALFDELERTEKETTP